MMYNMTNLSNADGFGSLMSEVNALSDGTMGIMIIGVVMIITFAMMKAGDNDTRKALAASCLISTLICILLIPAGIANWGVLALPGMGFLAGIVMYQVGQR